MCPQDYKGKIFHDNDHDELRCIVDVTLKQENSGWIHFTICTRDLKLDRHEYGLTGRCMKNVPVDERGHERLLLRGWWPLGFLATVPLSFAQTVSARCQRVISRRCFFKEAKAEATEEDDKGEEREEDLW